MMLELILTRFEEIDRRVVDHCQGLKSLVLDELHTYRGRQGADVALLVRRLRERLQANKLVCIGTSATMSSTGSLTEQNKTVADVASKFFGVPLSEQDIIGETLDISGPGKVLATLEAQNVRHVTLDARRFAPGRQEEGAQLYPVHFCRDCGQEYLPVWHSKRAPAFKALGFDRFKAARVLVFLTPVEVTLSTLLKDKGWQVLDFSSPEHWAEQFSAHANIFDPSE
jgi:hypothetical protein